VSRNVIVLPEVDETVTPPVELHLNVTSFDELADHGGNLGILLGCRC